MVSYIHLAYWPQGSSSGGERGHPPSPACETRKRSVEIVEATAMPGRTPITVANFQECTAYHGDGYVPIMHSRRTVSITSSELDLLDLYAEYAAAAYCNFDTPTDQLLKCEENCDRLLEDKGVVVKSFLTNNDIAGYVARVDSRKEIIFAVRGSKTLRNWGTNLDYKGITSLLAPGAWMHRGFYNAWREIARDVRTALFSTIIKYPDYNIVLTGHSLGGAVVTIAAAYLRAIDRYELDLYTYGQPRVGNSKFSDFISNQPGRLYRVTHNNDIVPKMPFVLQGYAHTSPEIWLTGKPTDPNNWPIADVTTCYGSLNFGCNANLSLPISFVDHDYYFGRISCKSGTGPGSADGAYFPEDIRELLEEEAAADAVLVGGTVPDGIAPGGFL
ncbi:Lipase (class 3) [Paramyrothecium foliicola]|nr:Lipase (class 3) [Paramyrothecium foliicola]